MKTLLLWTAVVLATVQLAPTMAMPAKYHEGVSLYEKGDYKGAIKKFMWLQRHEEDSELVHYHLALSYFKLHQQMPAYREFKWVAENGKQYKSAAQLSLKTFPKNIGSAEKAMPGIDGAEVRAQGKLKVIEFMRTWCPVCKRFAPIWNQVSTHMASQVDFQQVDTENPKYKALVEKYGIADSPVLLFTDKTGKVLFQKAGAPVNDAAFIKAIKAYMPQ